MKVITPAKLFRFGLGHVRSARQDGAVGAEACDVDAYDRLTHPFAPPRGGERFPVRRPVIGCSVGLGRGSIAVGPNTGGNGRARMFRERKSAAALNGCLYGREWYEVVCALRREVAEHSDLVDGALVAPDFCSLVYPQRGYETGELDLLLDQVWGVERGDVNCVPQAALSVERVVEGSTAAWGCR